MAGRKAGSPSRSEFIRKQLSAKPESKLSDINEAWKKSGNSGEITATLFYQVKSKAGGGRRRRGRPPGSGKRGPGRPPRSAGNASYLAIEQALDALIGAAESMNDQTLADNLRTARRSVSAKLV
jgi:hypothetical protein